MTWTSFPRRGEVLRNVIAAADIRRDGQLPLDVEGVAQTFGDEHTLLGALSLRWHTRLSGRIERELASQPMDLEAAVVAAWRGVAADMPGVREILDRHRAAPVDAEMAHMLAVAGGKEHAMLAMMAGRGSADDPATRRAGAEIEARARAAGAIAPPSRHHPAHRRRGSHLVRRIRSALAA